MPTLSPERLSVLESGRLINRSDNQLTRFEVRHTLSTLENDTGSFVTQDTVTLDLEGSYSPRLPQVHV